MMSLKLEIDGVLLNVVSTYAPQMGSDREKKEEFWEKLNEAVELIPKEERLIIGADFNGHVGEGNSGDERVIRKYGYGARNNEGQAIVDFAHPTHMAMINTFYSKHESHRVTYTSGGRHTQIDYILCCRVHLKEGRDSKELLGLTTGKKKEDKETWWNVKEAIARKKEAWKEWYEIKDLRSKFLYKEAKNKAKVAVAKAKKETKVMVAGITQDKVNKALKKMKRGKALGPDNIPIEAGVGYLASLFNKILAGERMPDEWR
ncbi:uncharacterized protein LOC122266465 [Penaeus japonicus]|uniref:uncharacterized protein LOC122266465 n=1 Tax=Penaeus japonicus TaxID=27405 RepID=UPI001C716F6D|nr:uncharacterized protein LOC122266465 [Penaeus japonicus]